MGKRYTPEERQEALKLASEIGNRAASERLGINLDTIYTWISKDRQRKNALQAVIEEKGPEGLAADYEALRKQLREREQEVEILQEALSFFRKAPEEVTKRSRMEFITRWRHRWPIVRMCRVLKVSESGYHKHVKSSSRPYRHADLLAQIYELSREDEENSS